MSQTQLFLFFVLDKELRKNLIQDEAQNKNGIPPNELQDLEQRLRIRHKDFEQCSGSVTFWYGSGSGDTYL
jgi:hypothetical protein